MISSYDACEMWSVAYIVYTVYSYRLEAPVFFVAVTQRLLCFARVALRLHGHYDYGRSSFCIKCVQLLNECLQFENHILCCNLGLFVK